jgi:hypothetical protein
MRLTLFWHGWARFGKLPKASTCRNNTCATLSRDLKISQREKLLAGRWSSLSGGMHQGRWGKFLR